LNRRELLFGIGALVTAPAWGNPPRRFTLLYPDLPDPERSVFRVIRESLASTLGRAGGTLTDHAITPSDTADAVSSLIAADHAEVLITLGRTATTLAQQLRPGIPWLTGATEVPVPSPGIGGISLTVNPDRFMATLTSVAPRINRISVVMDPARFGWLRTSMERAAHARSLQLKVYEATTVSEAASTSLNILRYGNPATDSLWLLEQGGLLNADTYPRLIEEAWANQTLIFSSDFHHVSEGALFALYMNPATLGARLAALAMGSSSHPAPIAFDDAPAHAINLRTARHLSSSVEIGAAQAFDVIVGER
jgi:ABC-type uncharacterized transport system substrate-binding protein